MVIRGRSDVKLVPWMSFYSSRQTELWIRLHHRVPKRDIKSSGAIKCYQTSKEKLNQFTAEMASNKTTTGFSLLFSFVLQICGALFHFQQSVLFLKKINALGFNYVYSSALFKPVHQIIYHVISLKPKRNRRLMEGLLPSLCGLLCVLLSFGEFNYMARQMARNA